MADKELIPCPFCRGGSQSLEDGVYGQDYHYAIKCCGCGCKLTMRYSEVVTGKRLYMADLIDIWNTRQPDKGPVLAGLPEVKEKLLEQYNRLVAVEREETGHGSTTFGEYLDMIYVIGMADFNKKLMIREAK